MGGGWVGEGGGIIGIKERREDEGVVRRCESN